MTKARDLSQVPNASLGFKNRIINGDMRIDQRNAGASVTPTNGQYLVDRWAYFGTQASKFTAQQGSAGAPDGFTNYLYMLVGSGYAVETSDAFNIDQRIEGLNVADLGWGTVTAQTVTISFRVFSSVTGTHCAAILNSAGNRSYVFTYSIPVANTWTTITATIPGDTTGTWLKNNGIGAILRFNLGAGSALQQTANVWGIGGWTASGTVNVVATTNNTFVITGVQLEKGSTATSFDYRPYGTELSLCQRYYEKTFSLNFVPQVGANSTSNADPYNAALLFAGHRAQQPNGVAPPSGFRWRVQKRAAPSITPFGNNSNAIAYRSTVAAAPSWYSGGNLGWVGTDHGIYLANEFTGDGFVQVIAHFTGTAEL